MDTRAGDPGLPGNSEDFEPLGCSTFKFSTPEQRPPVTISPDSSDHNFDTLRSSITMEPTKFQAAHSSPNLHMDPDIMTSGYKSSNSYLREYQEKYGKLGIFRDGDISTSESRTLCFPFLKENFRRVPGRKSFIGIERPGSPKYVPSVSASWDPSIMDSRYSPASSPLSSSPINSTPNYRNVLDGDVSQNIGMSSGRDWHCAVFGSAEKLQGTQSHEELSSDSANSGLREGGEVQDSLDDSGSSGDHLRRLSKSNVTVLAQTALRELEASYKRPQHDSDTRSEANSNPDAYHRDSSPLRELTSLAALGRSDVTPEGRIDNSIPVINISQDYEANDRTVRRGFRSRSGRRAVSDLGFTNREPGIVPTPRTAALLSSPAFKKHLAKNMGISEEDLNEKDFQYDFKLNLPGTSPTNTVLSETEVSPGSKLAATGLRERLLRTSVSDSSLHPPSCLNLSFGALSSDSSFHSLNKTMSDSYESVLAQSETRDSFTSPLGALNTGFTASHSLSDLPSPTLSDSSPGKVKFHIPSFREFKQQRTRRLTPRSPAGQDHFCFDFMSKNAIQEENESETSEKPDYRTVEPDLGTESVEDHDCDLDPDSETLVNALTSDLIEGEGQAVEVPEQFVDKPVLIYDPTIDVPIPDVDRLDPPEGFGLKHRGSERKSKRSASRSKSSGSVPENQEDLVKVCHEGDSQDSRGKHRKEPNRRSSRPSSKAGSEGQGEGQRDLTQIDSVFEGHQEIKLIKEFKIRDSSRGDSSDSKIMVVMVKDDAKETEGQKVKDKVTDRPPKPERRRRKDETKKNETYVIEGCVDVHIEQGLEQCETVECSDSPLHRDSSKSRSSKRSSSRSKRHHREDSSKERSEEKVQEFDDKVIGGHPGDGFEVKSRSDHFRRSSRRSSRRRFLPKSDAVEETGTIETPITSRAEDEEVDNKPSDLPTFPSIQLQQLAAENATVTRSVSDISDKKAEQQRKKGLRERRQKLYKSDPFHGGNRDPPPHDTLQGTPSAKTALTKQDLVGSRTSREEILNLIQDTKIGGATSSSVQSLDSFYDDGSSERAPSTSPPGTPQLFRHFPKYSLYPPLSPLWGRKCRSEEGPSGAEVERVDSGVGAELKDSSSSKEFKGGPICEDCEGDLTSENMSADSDFLCRKCESRRVERKETIQEIVDTEVSYGKDLKIIKEEFYSPMQTAGLLNEEQLNTVFSNLEELITINERFSDHLLDGLELANEQGDEDYNTVHIGRTFLEASNMLLAFETYCVNQASVPTLLEKLELDKELLRIFLHVSQTENSLLRRMNLKSFLMVPVQRVMKYPLLLGRLYKATAVHHEDRDSIKRAQNRVEDILEHINSQSRGGNNATMRLRRKISGLSVIKKTGSADDIEINKMAIEVLGWNRKDVNFIMSGRLMFTQPTDHLWMKKGRTLKFVPAFALLLTLGRSTGERWTGRLLFSKSTGIQDAALVLIKEKAGKFVPLRDPLKLERCVISIDPEFDEVFEIMDSNKESFLFKGEDRKDTQTWIKHLKLQTKDLGTWRKRRNALPNIMIHSTKT